MKNKHSFFSRASLAVLFFYFLVPNYLHALNQMSDELKNAIQLGDMSKITPLLNEKPIDFYDKECLVTPLQMAVESENIELLEYLLDCGAAPMVGGFPLPAFIVRKENSTDFDFQVIDLLIKRDPSIIKDNTYRTSDFSSIDESLLMVACSSGSVAMVEFLIRKDADLDGFNLIVSGLLASLWEDTEDRASSTPLNRAIQAGRLEVVDLLLKSGASPDMTGLDNESPLKTAIVCDEAAIAQLLLDYRANPNVLDSEGNSLLAIAIKKMLESSTVNR